MFWFPSAGVASALLRSAGWAAALRPPRPRAGPHWKSPPCGRAPRPRSSQRGRLPAAGGWGRRWRPLSPPGAGRGVPGQPCRSPHRRLARQRAFSAAGASPPQDRCLRNGSRASRAPPPPPHRLSFCHAPDPLSARQGTREPPCLARPGAAPARPVPCAPELAARRSPLQAALLVLFCCRFVVPVRERGRSGLSLVLQPPRVCRPALSAGFSCGPPAA